MIPTQEELEAMFPDKFWTTRSTMGEIARRPRSPGTRREGRCAETGS